MGDEQQGNAKRDSATLESAALPTAQLVVVSCLAVAVLAAGVVATFETSNGAGSAALIAGGLGLLVVAFLGNRIELVKFAGVEAHLRAANELLKRADQLDADGQVDEAEELRSEATRLLLRAGPSAQAYEQVRASQAPGPRRTAQLYETVRRAEQFSRDERPSALAVKAQFGQGGEGDRLFALVLMREDPSVADVEAVLDAISNSRSAFEQYQALDAAERLLPRLDPQTRGLLQLALVEQTGPAGWIKPTTDRWPAAQRLLRSLDAGARH